jgi:3-hydroxyisobutyrate dehydrogenase
VARLKATDTSRRSKFNMRIGFIGLGMMGTPMALNLARRFSITVWNRSPSKYQALKNAGATIGQTPSQVAEESDIIITMLFDGTAIQSIMNDSFKKALDGKTLINTSSVSVEFSRDLSG